MKKFRPLIFIAAIIALLLILKFLFFPAGEEESKSGGGKGASAPPLNVNGYVIKSTSIDNRLFVTGSILSNEMVSLRPEISGKVAAVNIREGQPVKKGQLLVKLVDTDLQAQLRKVSAQQKLMEDRLKRLDQLLKVQGVSQEEYDAAVNQLEALKADASVLGVQISRTQLNAPFDGIIGLRNISEGSYISPVDVVVNIQQINPVKIDFSVPEKYSSLVKEGAKITFSVEGHDSTYSGTVYATEPEIDSGTRTLKVRARAENKNNRILPGSFARVELELEEISNALMIPTESIVPVLKGQQVFVSRNGMAEAVPVKTGVRQDKMVQIVEGLNTGDTVVTTGVMSVRPKSPLKFKKVD